ncbi:MAG: M14 family metallopeptidase [Candidatus Saccharimonadales bacterium]
MLKQKLKLVTTLLRSAPQTLRSFTRQRPRLVLALLLAPIGLLIALSYFPRQLTFTYAQPSCITNPLLLPNLHRTTASAAYELTHTPLISIGSYPLLSLDSCATALAPPPLQTETVKLHFLHLPILHKSIQLKAETAPQLTTATDYLKQISVIDPLVLELDQADTVSDYTLQVGEDEVTCTTVMTELICPVEQLKLKQASRYSISITRSVQDQIAAILLSTEVETVTPIAVENASVEHKSTVHQIIDAITITMNKSVASVGQFELRRTDQTEPESIPLDISAADKKITIALSAPLAREATYELNASDITATDKGFLISPLKLQFTTSGGPQVENVNISRYAVSRNADPLISFDYPLSEEQDLKQHLTIEVGGKNLPLHSVVVNGARVTLIPAALLPHCSPITIKVSDNLENRHGVSGSTAYEYKSHTVCQQVTNIGSSIAGRAIPAYSFGNGAEKIIYVGALHGNEASSKYILDAWIAELEANYSQIPANRTIIVVPQVNPDGIAAGRRTNSRGVDLNRNFPANDWKSDVTVPGGQLVEEGGGKSPLSEPETSALANFILNQNPKLVLSYHAVASLVIANESGNSRQLASQYGQAVGYHSLGGYDQGDTFAYDTTGSLESWLHDKYGLPSLLIELSTYSGSEFYYHRSAMWQMVNH